MDIKSPSIQMVERLWVGSGWAAGNGPKAGQWAQGPFLGLPKAGHQLDMCLIFVQHLSQQGILWCAYNLDWNCLMDKRWTDFGFPRVKRLSKFCLLAGSPDCRGVNSHVQRLTRFCLADFLSILVTQEDKLRTNVRSKEQILDLART